MDSHKRHMEIQKVAFSNQKIANQLGRKADTPPTTSSIYANILSRDTVRRG